MDAHNRIVSNHIEIRIEAPTSKMDVNWVKDAQRHPAEYGLFICFGGGDHLANGRRILEEKSKHVGTSEQWVKAILAGNHAQSARDMRNMKILRKADLDLAMSQMPQDGVPPGFCISLQNIFG